MSTPRHAITRRNAQVAARRLLEQPRFARYRPGLGHGWASRALGDLAAALGRLTSIVTGHAVAAGVLCLLGLALLTVALAVRHAHRDVRAAATRVRDTDPPATALRARADEALAAGDYRGVVSFGLRALSRALDESTVLPPKPGRTAGELSGEVQPWLDTLAATSVRAAATAFDAVVYGGRAAGRREADLVLRAYELTVAQLPGRPGKLPAVPETLVARPGRPR